MARRTKEYQAFTQLVDRLLTVPRSAIVERIAAHREKAAQNPRKRGPKAKPPGPTGTHPDTESDG